MRTIDADALKNKFWHGDLILNKDLFHISEIRYLIDNAPTVVAENAITEPAGEWIREKEEGLKDKYRCSICGRRVDEVDDYLLLDEDNRVSDIYPYCHCGAKMKGVNYEKKSI